MLPDFIFGSIYITTDLTTAVDTDKPADNFYLDFPKGIR